eukprot:GHVT01099252.1.p1 GENE.GHVT01099252.1~~GHVT01099252.1.p1  ORF type:complete len:506 (-),score=32.85 GHVT01099252.1:1544-3061(-)
MMLPRNDLPRQSDMPALSEAVLEALSGALIDDWGDVSAAAATALASLATVAAGEEEAVIDNIMSSNRRTSSSSGDGLDSYKLGSWSRKAEGTRAGLHKSTPSTTLSEPPSDVKGEQPAEENDVLTASALLTRRNVQASLWPRVLWDLLNIEGSVLHKEKVHVAFLRAIAAASRLVLCHPRSLAAHAPVICLGTVASSGCMEGRVPTGVSAPGYSSEVPDVQGHNLVKRQEGNEVEVKKQQEASLDELELVDKIVTTLVHVVTNGLSPKVTWNAICALRGVYATRIFAPYNRNSEAPETNHPAQMLHEKILSHLCQTVDTSSNLKVRIHSIQALSHIPSHFTLNISLLSRCWNSVLSAYSAITGVRKIDWSTNQPATKSPFLPPGARARYERALYERILVIVTKFLAPHTVRLLGLSDKNVAGLTNWANPIPDKTSADETGTSCYCWQQSGVCTTLLFKTLAGWRPTLSILNGSLSTSQEPETRNELESFLCIIDKVLGPSINDRQ